MSKHTPGPWRLVEGELYNEHYHAIEGGCGYHDFDDGATSEGFRLTGYAPEAVARLVVAAPEMLEALATLLGACEFDCMDDKSNVYRSAMIDARAAIARAEGRDEK